MAFLPQLPANGPPWLPRFASSIADLFRRVLPSPLKLFSIATADLPPAADYLGGIIHDSTVDTLKIALGAGWSSFSLSTHVHAASTITFAPAGGIAATDVQAAIVELDTEKLAASAVSAFGLTLIDDADATTARDTLGLGTIATQAANSVAITGGSITGLSASLSVSASASGAGRGAFFDNTNTAGYSMIRLGSGGADVGSGMLFYYFGSTYGGVGAFAATTSAWGGYGTAGVAVVAYNGPFSVYTGASSVAAKRLEVNSSGLSLSTGLTYKINGVQVVQARITGWAAASGTATRTTFATSTVTTAELAERVKALIDDLRTHGLIGT